MTDSLYSANTPQAFWRVQTSITPEIWQAAIQTALPKLGFPAADLAAALEMSLGEGQFGQAPWEMSFAKRAYYLLKPVLPRALTRRMRKVYSGSRQASFPLGWPIETRYADFQWECLRQLLLLQQADTLPLLNLWPANHRAAFILTHDIETAAGQRFASQVADLEEQMGLRSSFNFVPERYPIDHGLISGLRSRGFEVGVHGLKHDGRLFLAREQFNQRAQRINHHLRQLQASGFRAPLTHRNPHWMQALEMDYDLSFFDTDPYEPIPGGTMSLWPYQIGHFMELPYTLPQDYTLVNILEATTPAVWLEKAAFLEKNHGMILVNTHPDYLLQAQNWQVYATFLQEMTTHPQLWHALPCQAAAWWRTRPDARIVHAHLTDTSVQIDLSAPEKK